MAIAISNQDRRIMGDRVVIDAKVTFSGTYPSNGEPIAASDFDGLIQIDSCIPHSQSAAGISVVFDSANSKLKVFDENDSTGVEAEFSGTCTINHLVQITGK